MPAFVGYVDRDGLFRAVNTRLADLFGATPEALVGVDAFAVEARGFRLSRAAFERALAGEFIRSQSSLVGPDGESIFLAVTYQVHRVKDAVIGVCVCAFDITEHEQAIRALRDSRKRFRRLIEIMPYGICRTDRQGYLLMSNPAHARMLGYKPAELIGRSAWDFFMLGEREAQQEIFSRALIDRPEPTPSLGQCIRKDGSLIDVLFNWTYDVDDHGEPVGFIAVMTDVTDSLAMQRELVKAKEIAERASEEKSRFLAAASHDLQQPLHSLSIMLGLLRTQTNESRRAEILDTMEKAVEGAQGLLRAVLDLSKLEAGVVEPRLEAIPLGELLNQIVAELGPQTAHKPVELRVISSTRSVWSDRVLLKSILYNLVSNALRYTPRGKVLVGARLKGQELSVEVWDTGVGIPKERQRDIFKEFTRLESGQQGGGAVHSLGLGLSIVDRACDLLGHRLTLSSQQGKGSVFRVLVPLADAVESDVSTEILYDHQSAGHQGGLVLVLEDHPDLAEATCQILEAWGYRCYAARDLASALKEIKRNGPPNLILADYNLSSDKNGLEMIDVIRERCGREIAAILLTGERGRQPLDQARRRKIPVQRKPMHPARLRALVSYQLDQTPRTR